MRVLLATPDCGIQPDNLEMKLFDSLFFLNYVIYTVTRIAQELRVKVSFIALFDFDFIQFRDSI